MQAVDTQVSDAVDVVVLLDDDARMLGTAPRASVHSQATPLHLAFSCYVLDGDGRLLVTRRALSKATWPGVWTNSVCGHPRPQESMEAAIRRRAIDELGLAVGEIREALPTFRYRAVDASGVVEHEVCPVFVAIAQSEVTPDPGEVMDFTWVEPTALIAAAAATPWAFSPWLVAQLASTEMQGALT